MISSLFHLPYSLFKRHPVFFTDLTSGSWIPLGRLGALSLVEGPETGYCVSQSYR